jgi:hypothetical protein
MSWNHREDSFKPFVSSLVNIRVANSREKDLDVDTVLANWAKWDFGLLKFRL